MTFSKRMLSILIATATVATSAATLPASANAVSVSRCNASDGTNVPSLHFINGGDRFIVRIGQGGLTRNDVYNERAAFSWAAASGLFPDGSTFGNYSSFICGLPDEDDDTRPEPVAAPPQEPEQPELPEPPQCDECISLG